MVLARLEELAIIHRAKWAIYGAGALGREIVLNRRIGKILLEKLVGFLDTDAQRQGSLFLGYPVMQPTEYLLTHSIDLVLVAIGSEAGREAAKLTLATTGFNLSHTIDWR